MSDTAQQNLREPEQADWDNWGRAYIPPPAATDAEGHPIIYYGVVEKAIERESEYAQDAEGQQFLNYLLDPIKIVRSNNGADGYQIRFTEASTRPFERDGVPIKGNPNKLGNYLRACGLQAKPQLNSEYRAAVRAVQGRPFPFVGDWEAYNKDTGERVKGYLNFPDDPDRPGHKKAILHAGDIVTARDGKGHIVETRTISSEVLFANFRLRYFKDAAPKTPTGLGENR